MRLSAPIYILKQQAKALARSERIPLHLALDRIANREGFRVWSHLAARCREDDPSSVLFTQLNPGSLVLLAGRPGQGKTLLGIGLIIEALSRGQRAAFFTLELTVADVARRLRSFDREWDEFGDELVVDASDRIDAGYIVSQLTSAPPNTLVVIDYLQLLDQRRESPALTEQVAILKRFAEDRRLIIVCLSQVDRHYDLAGKPYPDLSDVRMPNPLDLTLFDKACFLNQGRMQVASVG